MSVKANTVTANELYYFEEVAREQQVEELNAIELDNDFLVDGDFDFVDLLSDS